jgi:hypothetical protein
MSALSSKPCSSPPLGGPAVPKVSPVFGSMVDGEEKMVWQPRFTATDRQGKGTTTYDSANAHPPLKHIVSGTTCPQSAARTVDVVRIGGKAREPAVTSYRHKDVFVRLCVITDQQPLRGLQKHN